MFHVNSILETLNASPVKGTSLKARCHTPLRSIEITSKISHYSYLI